MEIEAIACPLSESLVIVDHAGHHDNICCVFEDDMDDAWRIEELTVTGYLPPDRALTYGDVDSYDHLSLDFPNLKTFHIPNTCTKLGHAFFYDCSKLETVTGGNTLAGISPRCFFQCTSLTNIVIGDSVKYIGRYAFNRCVSLTSIVIPDSVAVIENGTFWGCSLLEHVEIPNSVTRIGASAFWGCALKSITIPSSVTRIECRVFEWCRSLTSIAILGAVGTILGHTFEGCCSLTSITLPSSVTSIENRAFLKCSSLQSVVAPGLRTVEQFVFDDCPMLRVVVVAFHPNTDEGNAAYATLCHNIKFSCPHVTVLQHGGLAIDNRRFHVNEYGAAEIEMRQQRRLVHRNARWFVIFMEARRIQDPNREWNLQLPPELVQFIASFLTWLSPGGFVYRPSLPPPPENE